MCVRVRGMLTPTKNHLSTVELCHLKHDVVSALAVSSVVMSGGIFSPATRRSVPRTTFSRAAMVTLAVSVSGTKRA